MSTSLYWSPIPQQPKERSIGNLKRILAKKLSDSDGSSSDDLGTVGPELIPFLEGIVAGGDGDKAKDAQSLIDAIEKYGKVNLVIHS